MKREQARRLRDRIGVLGNPCDLDLLLFFVRHPRSLLTSDQIAAYIGYDVKQIGDSLDALLASKLLTRSQNPARAARMYVFGISGQDGGGGWLSSLVDFVSTREGRLAMREALTERRRENPGEPTASLERGPWYRAG